ncbi:hypothetical protein M5X06_22150 [Paenibacillus alvei]|uniref:TraC-like domain-containing protein n=1 Tax=Paenibacillus alvei TaxID=44250 RepID=A0ABT4H2P0_PAEAL|nr:hypothetical protein [Paenibacillus alvei]MCY9763219.1 hypothetical protein [Paenibacillus alvei]MCY9769492.1 hypothetical protein [Paenibacillus alvei]
MGLKDRLKQHAKGKNKKAPGKKVSNASSTNPSTQTWMPIKDINNNLLYRKDSMIVATIRVQPVNLDLLSNNEKSRKIKQLEEQINGINYKLQILSIAKPVDLDGFILKMEHAKQQADGNLEIRLLSHYIEQATYKAISGEALERHFYILIPAELGKKPELDEQMLIQRASELASSLTSAELFSHVCSDPELQDLQFIFNNPNQAAYERSPLTATSIPPVYFAEEVYQ